MKGCLSTLLKCFLVFNMVVIAILFLGVITISFNSTEVKYPSGRDTVSSFGDGSFQICKSQYNDQYIKGLFSGQYGTCIIPYVEEVYETESRVYIIGAEFGGYKPEIGFFDRLYNVYAIVDLAENVLEIYAEPLNESLLGYRLEKLANMVSNGDIIMHDNIEKFTEEDNTFFQKLKQISLENPA